jgi:flagellar motor switch protein FliN
MAETIEYEQFDSAPAASNGTNSTADLSRLSEIPMELSVEIGRTHMTVGQTLELRVGAVVELEREAGDPVDLLVNGSPIARGEVIVSDERYGLRITEILDGSGGEQAAVAPAALDAEPSSPDGGEPAGAEG